ncbi:MAG: hypothetical protein ACRD2C_08355 [Acidimicrobiales bacterium]
MIDQVPIQSEAVKPLVLSPGSGLRLRLAPKGMPLQVVQPAAAFGSQVNT